MKPTDKSQSLSVRIGRVERIGCPVAFRTEAVLRRVALQQRRRTRSEAARIPM